MSTELLAAARAQIARFVGARSDDAVVFTRHTTDALNLLARALPEGTHVVTFAAEHHANLLPWRRHGHDHLEVPARRDQCVEVLDAALARLPRGPRLFAVSGASNVTGETWPLAELCAAARRHGARVVVDAAQLAAHRGVDLAALGADYLALSGHKLYAPFGCGVLVGRPDWLDAAPPCLAGAGAVRRVTLDDEEWTTGAARHEAGTPNVLGAVALAAACAALRDAGAERVAARERELTGRLSRGLADVPRVRRLSIWDGEHDRIGVVAFTVDRIRPGPLAAALSAERGVGVRDGAFCAHPLVTRLLGASTSSPPAALRASVGVGTVHDDVDRFVAALKTLVTRGPRWHYRQDGGQWVPDPDPRPRPALPTFTSLGSDAPRRDEAGCAGR